MKFIKNIPAKVGAAALVAGAWASVALAQSPFQVGEGQVKSIQPVDSSSISEVVNNIINIGLSIVGLLAVVYLIYGGLLYITAGGDAEKAGKGRTAITNAIIGIVIVLAALIIYNGVIGSFNKPNLA